MKPGGYRLSSVHGDINKVTEPGPVVEWEERSVDRLGPHDIACKLNSGPALRAATQVLDRIRAAQPEDYNRLIRVVRDIVPLGAGEKQDGTLGEWFADHPNENNPATWGYGYDETP